ncbi:MAG TPA: alcohol dehydrogenase catalytic domain-containing protein [Candidatus Binatia bacterium]|nr:alcohol dehydrogenase catalytic domain-containing protein [Candidatus Binatia bacterium]
MRALVYAGEGRVRLSDVPEPELAEPGDALLRVTTTAICGSDLHLLHGRIPGIRPGSVLGHEFAGVVEAVGASVSRFHAGDRALASFTVPCGACWYCGRGLFSRCADQRVFGYGAAHGDLGGGQAELVRVPNADLVLHAIEPGLSDERALFAGDIFSAGLDAAAEARIEAGDTVLVVGCGPVGLMAAMASATFGPARLLAADAVSSRLEAAGRLGAEPLPADQGLAARVRERTGGRGADAVLECVGNAQALEAALASVRRGGRVSVIGVHTEPEWTLGLGRLFAKAVHLEFCGVANVLGRWDQALDLIRRGLAEPAAIISHRLPLEEAVAGYHLFESRQALKVVLTV